MQGFLKRRRCKDDHTVQRYNQRIYTVQLLYQKNGCRQRECCMARGISSSLFTFGRSWDNTYSYQLTINTHILFLLNKNREICFIIYTIVVDASTISCITLCSLCVILDLAIGFALLL